MKNQVGLLTTHSAINYGAVLQAYALCETIKELKGECEVINLFMESKLVGRKYNYNFNTLKDSLNSLYLIFNFRYRKYIRKRIDAFDAFLANHFCLSEEKYSSYEELCSRIPSHYKYLVCGSDQIWNLNLFDEPSYFLRFEKQLPDAVCVAYAASIAEKMTEEQKQRIVENTGHFSAISVREKEGADLLNTLTEIPVKHVLDPVFLLDVSDWDKLMKPVLGIKKPYILLYSIAGNEEYAKVIGKLRKYLGYQVVCINTHLYNKYNADVLLSDTSPENFLWLLRNAAWVCTSSFHALAFSIIFEKPFVIVPDRKRASRHVNITEQLGISERLYFSSSDFYPEMLTDIDYNTVKSKLAEQREYSLLFLKEALNIKK